MYAALRQHPGIFMPELKEPAYFCRDLDPGEDFGAVHFISDEDEYGRLFDPAAPGQLVGEACALNLYSRVASARIRQVAPDARVIVHVRDPVEQMASWHSTLVFNDVELTADFERALADERTRVQMGSRSRNGSFTPLTLYRAFSSFSEQIERYLAAFPREQVKVVVLDDFAANPSATVSGVFSFLGLDEGFQPQLTVQLQNHRFASRRFRQALKSRRLIGLAKAVVPRRLHGRAGRVAQGAFERNVRVAPRQGMARELRDQLRVDMADEVGRLGELLQRDLAALWWGPSATR